MLSSTDGMLVNDMYLQFPNHKNWIRVILQLARLIMASVSNMFLKNSANSEEITQQSTLLLDTILPSFQSEFEKHIDKIVGPSKIFDEIDFIPELNVFNCGLPNLIKPILDRKVIVHENFYIRSVIIAWQTLSLMTLEQVKKLPSAEGDKYITDFYKVIFDVDFVEKVINK
jgi:hypothetical protein